MDQTEEPQTPRRIYYKANICVLCGLAFVQAEVTSTRETIKKKLINKKLKLTEEKISAIRNVLGEFNHECITSNNGVCKQCFRTIERINKAERTTEKAFVMSNLIGQYFVSICKLIRSREDDL